MNSSDYLERLWVEVIDVESKTDWVGQCLEASSTKASSLFTEVRPSLQRLFAQGAARGDLQLLGAFVRYETCFGVLCSLDDPGLGKGKIAGLHKDFIASRPNDGKARTKRQEFIQWLWETESFLKDDAKWLRDVTKKQISTEPFRSLFPAVQRLLKKVKKLRDLGAFLGWNRYQACANALRLLEEAGFQTGSEPLGLHEMLLTSYPGGRQKEASKKGQGPARPSEPLWQIKSAQTIAFSPDSKTLALAGASSPVRLYDLSTGQERLACEGLRIHIYRIAFSPDGTQVAAGQINKNITICDPRTGKLLHKLRYGDDEISGLQYSPQGTLFCSSWCKDVTVFDARTGTKFPPLSVSSERTLVLGMAVLDEGIRVATLSDETVTIWSWPDRKKLLQSKIPKSYGSRSFASSPDGRTLAVGHYRGPGTGIIYLFDAKTGKGLGTIKAERTHWMTFAPDGAHLIFNAGDDDELCIWNYRTSREVCKLNPKGSVFGLEVSPDGEYLAAATERAALVWRLQPLLPAGD